MELTEDRFLQGDLRLRQYRRGYRFSVDAAILGHYAAERIRAGRVLDLGTGCGIIPLILAHANPRLLIWGVEIQPELARLAQENVALNQMADRIRILEGDLRGLRPADLGGPMQWVLSNPPYRRIDSGRINPHPQRAAARHEIHCDLADLIRAGRRFLEKSGRMVVIHLAERLAELLREMSGQQMEPKYLQTIHSVAGAEAKLVLAEAVRGARPGMKIGPGLAIYGADGGYTPELAAMMAGKKEGE